MKAQRYASATALRRALEDRLATIAKEEGVDLQRLRRQVAFDRLLCRLFHKPDAPWVLKGGHAMELRVKTARTTRDIDLAIRNLPMNQASWDQKANEVLLMLQQAASLDLRDYFVFLVGTPVQDMDAAPYGGARFPVETRMDGRTFTKFHVDISAGDVLREPYELLHGRDWLEFAAIPMQDFPAISKEEQFAEKLHAYTLPRGERENSRVKDLIDLVLLIKHERVDPSKLVQSIRDTFERRKTHVVPASLQTPPDFWKQPFAEMARECGLDPNIEIQFNEVQAFLQRILPISRR